MDGETHKFIEDYKESLSATAADLIQNQFPDKMKSIEKFLETEFTEPTLTEIKSESLKCLPAENAPTEGRVVGSNLKLSALLEKVKDELHAMRDDSIRLMMWIELLIPRIQDGNNFGVEVQIDVQKKIIRARDDATQLLKLLGTYYSVRGKAASKVIKYPTVMDYRHDIGEIDKSAYYHARYATQYMVNKYARLTDVVTKNKNHIEKPRNENFSSMY